MDFEILEKRLGVVFHERSYLKQAFTHKSYLNENHSWPLGHNERLEFLGDAVLELVVTNYLFKKYPSKTEGDLTRFRAAIVGTPAIFATSVKLGFDEYLLLSRGEANDTGRARYFLLANTFEAVIAAIFLDQGLDVAEKFILEQHLVNSDELIAQSETSDTKSRLQIYAQEKLKITPNYHVLSESGLDHEKIFEVGVYFNSVLIAQGHGCAKKIAEAEAAKNALIMKGWVV